MRRIAAFTICASLFASSPAAALTLAGFTFPADEVAFADDAFLVSGVITGADEAQIRTILVGTDLADSFNTGDSGGGIVEVRFTDNSILNGPGPDLVIFELSGDQPAGTPDPREIFRVSIYDGTAFSPFVTVTPIATGFNNPVDPTLDVFSVQIDLANFGIPSDTAIDRVRLHIFNANLGSKSADLTALGALNSAAPIPEPSTGALLALGVVCLALMSIASNHRAECHSCVRRAQPLRALKRAGRASAIVLLLATPSAANLIVNGSFELPGGSGDPTFFTGSTALPGWIVTRDSIDYIGGCSDGLRCLDLDGTIGFGAIAQSFSTIPGVIYRVLFDMSANPSRYDPAEPAEKFMRIEAAGSLADYSFVITGPREGMPTGWVTHEWTFTASTTTSTLEFLSLDSTAAGHSGFFGPALDNVVVQAIPEPSSLALVMGGLAGLAIHRWRQLR